MDVLIGYLSFDKGNVGSLNCTGYSNSLPNKCFSMFLEKCFIGCLYEPSLSLGVFALLQAYAFLQYLRDRLTKQEFQTLFFLGVSLAAGAVFLSVIYLTYTGRYHHLSDVNLVSRSLQKVNSFANFIHVLFILVGQLLFSYKQYENNKLKVLKSEQHYRFPSFFKQYLCCFRFC